MKRLIDDAATGREAEQNRELLAALESDAARTDRSMEEHVWSRLSTGERRLVPRRVRPAAVATAAAVVAMAVTAIVLLRSRTTPPPASSPEMEVSAPTQPDLGPTPDATDFAIAPDLAMPPASSAPRPHARPHLTPPAEAPTPRAAPRDEAPPAPDLEESRLLHEAYSALRRDRDRARALERVDQYLKRYPAGGLGEEALVLALEASADDPVSAAPYARAYLQRFPTGAHAKQARTILQRD